MTSFRDLIPSFLLEKLRRLKRKAKRNRLEKEMKAGNFITKELLVQDLFALGIKPNDSLLVHASLSSIGFVDGGAENVINAFLEVIPEGNLLMPTSPNGGLQLDYIQQLEVYNPTTNPSKLGKLSETFRQLNTTVRSLHPTEPVSALGKDKYWFIEGHENELTPYSKSSPFYKLALKEGKILYIGVTLKNAGTSLHLLEDEIRDFPYEIYYPKVFEYKILTDDGIQIKTTKVHNPEWSAKRKCDELIPLFTQLEVARWGKFGKSDVLLMEAKGMFQAMVFLYQKYGITMYHTQLKQQDIKLLRQEFEAFKSTYIIE